MFNVQVLKSRFKVGLHIMQLKVGTEISENPPCLPIMQFHVKCTVFQSSKIAKSTSKSSTQIPETSCRCVIMQVYPRTSE